MISSTSACIASRSACVHTPGVDDVRGKRHERIDDLPGLDLVLLAIRTRIGRRMAAEAIGHRVEQHRPVAPLDDLALAANRVDHRQRIVAVDALGVQLVGCEAGTHAGQDLEAHRFADGLAAHAVEVVHEVHDQRQPAAMRLVPQLLELVHRGEAEGLPCRAAARRRVADVGDHDARLLVDVLEQRRPHGDVGRPADDRVVRIDAERREKRVHRAAEAAVDARVAGEDLRQRSVDDKIDRQVLRSSRRRPFSTTRKHSPPK